MPVNPESTGVEALERPLAEARRSRCPSRRAPTSSRPRARRRRPRSGVDDAEALDGVDDEQPVADHLADRRRGRHEVAGAEVDEAHRHGAACRRRAARGRSGRDVAVVGLEPLQLRSSRAPPRRARRRRSGSGTPPGESSSPPASPNIACMSPGSCSAGTRPGRRHPVRAAAATQLARLAGRDSSTQIDARRRARAQQLERRRAPRRHGRRQRAERGPVEVAGLLVEPRQK